jgi:hypothetical protein
MKNLADVAATYARIETLERENREIEDELARIRGVAPATSRPTDRSGWIGLACGLVLLALNIAMCNQSAG